MHPARLAGPAARALVTAAIDVRLVAVLDTVLALLREVRADEVARVDAVLVRTDLAGRAGVRDVRVAPGLATLIGPGAALSPGASAVADALGRELAVVPDGPGRDAGAALRVIVDFVYTHLARLAARGLRIAAMVATLFALLAQLASHTGVLGPAGVRIAHTKLHESTGRRRAVSDGAVGTGFELGGPHGRWSAVGRGVVAVVREIAAIIRKVLASIRKG